MEVQNNMENNNHSLYWRVDRFNSWCRRGYHLFSSFDLLRHASLSCHSYRALHGDVYGGKYNNLISHLKLALYFVFTILRSVCGIRYFYRSYHNIENSEKVRKAIIANIHLSSCANYSCHRNNY